MTALPDRSEGALDAPAPDRPSASAPKHLAPELTWVRLWGVDTGPPVGCTLTPRMARQLARQIKRLKWRAGYR